MNLICLTVGDRTTAAKLDLSAYLPEEVEQEVKEAAEISMGTEISDEDLLNITYLCDQVCVRCGSEIMLLSSRFCVW